MKAICENIDNLDNALRSVKNHCMCYRFTENESQYLVTFPAGYQIDGVRASKAIGKIEALRRIFDTMERAWNYQI
jgi:hypothetical protein